MRLAFEQNDRTLHTNSTVYKQARTCLTTGKLRRGQRGNIHRLRARDMVLACYAMMDGPYPEFDERWRLQRVTLLLC